MDPRAVPSGTFACPSSASAPSQLPSPSLPKEPEKVSAMYKQQK